MAKLVAKTYGDALFSIGVEKNILDKLFEEATVLKKVINENSKFQTVLNHPKVAKSEKNKIIEEIFSEQFSKEMVGFLLICIRKNRFSDIKEILEYFISTIKEEKKIGVVYITLAQEITDSYKEKIENKIISTTKYESLECHYEIDKSLIAGVKIRIGDRIVDSTIKNKLESMTKDLHKIQLS